MRPFSINNLPDTATHDAEITQICADFVDIAESITGTRPEPIAAFGSYNVVRFEFERPSKACVEQLVESEDQIQMRLCIAGCHRFDTTDESILAVEVPQDESSVYSLRTALRDEDFFALPQYCIPIGMSVRNEVMYWDFARYPTMAVSASGEESVPMLLRDIMIGLAQKSSPYDLRFILLDPVGIFDGVDLPHAICAPVTDSREIEYVADDWLRGEWLWRRMQLARYECSDIDQYNARDEVARQVFPFMPRLVVILTETSELFETDGRDYIGSLNGLADDAAKLGIYFIIATQAPDDISLSHRLLNFPSRISFWQKDAETSKLAIGSNAAEYLLNNSDMIVKCGADLIRGTCPFINSGELSMMFGLIRTKYKNRR